MAKSNKDPKKGDLETTAKDAAEVKGGAKRPDMKKAARRPGVKRV